MTKKFITLLIACAAALAAFAASDKYPDISHDELKAALAAGRVTLIDVNGSESYAKGHIPGAMNFASVKSELASKLPADKSALVVAYCGGPRCQAYKQAAAQAVALGYTNVKHYSGGISGWEEKGEPTSKG